MRCLVHRVRNNNSLMSAFIEWIFHLSSDGLLATTDMDKRLCFPPSKSLHRLASRASEDRDITSKCFFMELILIGYEQQGVITPEQHADALSLLVDYGRKVRNTKEE